MPWPLQGDPPGAKKNLNSSPGGPQGPTRREDTPPRNPPGTLKARKPLFFHKGTPPPRPSFGKTSFFRIINKSFVFPLSFAIMHALAAPRGPLWRVLGPSNLVHASPRTSPRAPVGQACAPKIPKNPPQGSQAPLGTSEMSKVDHQNTMEI